MSLKWNTMNTGMFPNGNVQSPDNYLRPVEKSTFRTGLAPRENQMKRVHSDCLSLLEGTLPQKKPKIRRKEDFGWGRRSMDPF